MDESISVKKIGLLGACVDQTKLDLTTQGAKIQILRTEGDSNEHFSERPRRL